MSSPLPTALILGVDTPIGLAVIRDLGRHGVPVHGIGRSGRALGRASRYLSGFSVRGAGPLADWVPARVAETGAVAVFAIAEHDLIALADLHGTISGCQVLTPAADPLQKVLDKSATLALARDIGIAVPDSLQPTSPDVQPAALPVVLKWADPARVVDRLANHGIALLKTEYCRTSADLQAVLRRYEPAGIYPLVQSYCPGVGLGQMLHMAGGKATLRFQHERIHEWPPEGGVSTWCRAVPLSQHAAQMDKSEALLRALDWQGPAMVEYRYDAREGTYRLMEINGRFWGSQPLAVHAGAYFAWEAYRRAVLGDPTEAVKPRGGVEARFLLPDTRRLLQLMFRRRMIADPNFRATPIADATNWLAGFFDPRVKGYLWDWRDPAPALADIVNMALKLAGR